MSRQRFIYPETFTSDDFTSLTFGARLLFIGLIGTADDYGRGKGNSRCMKAAIFPADDCSFADVGGWAAELDGRDMVLFYDAEKARCYQIVNWDRYQKPKYKAASKVPQFQGDAGSRAKPGPDPETGGVGWGGVKRGEEKRKSKIKISADPGFVAFKDWAYKTWQESGNSGSWAAAEWTRLHTAYKGFLTSNNGTGDATARQSWRCYLADIDKFYTGHYPKKWASEPSRWLEKGKAAPGLIHRENQPPAGAGYDCPCGQHLDTGEQVKAHASHFAKETP